MRKTVLLVVCLNVLWPAMMLLTDLVQAADEDLTSSVYLVFDPETGDFVTVHDADRTLQNLEAQEPAAAAVGSSPTSGQPAATSSLPIAVGIVIGVGLLAGVLVWTRKKKHAAQ